MPVLYLLDQGSTLHKDGEVFTITKEGQTLQKIPAIKVEQVVIFGNVNLTTPVIHYLLRQGIDCVFCSSYGKFHGRLISTESKFGLLRQCQMETILQPEKKLAIARTFVQGRLTNQRTLLMRYRRELELPQLDRTITELEVAIEKLKAPVDDLAILQGIEGSASASYYRAFKEILKQDLGFITRARRPPTDPVNSLLSFGYTLLVYAIQAAVSTVGLDPFLGFLHSTAHSRPSLVLDLMEEFRPIIIDSLVLWLVNSRVMTEQDFRHPEGDKMVLLTEDGMKKFIHHYEQKLQSQIYHPRAGGQVNYRRCFELQARGLAQVILNRESEYKPFLVR